MTLAGTAAQTKLFRVVFPLVVAASLVTVEAVSTIEPTVWVVSGGAASVASVAYAGVMVWLVFAPPQPARVHGAAAALAVLVAAGRTGGFVEYMVDRERWDLAGTVVERVVILVALLLWHQVAALDHAERLHDDQR